MSSASRVTIVAPRDIASWTFSLSFRCCSAVMFSGCVWRWRTYTAYHRVFIRPASRDARSTSGFAISGSNGTATARRTSALPSTTTAEGPPEYVAVCRRAGSRRLIGRVDLPLAQALLQFGDGKIDEDDRIRLAHDAVGNALPDVDARRRADDVLHAFEMLDVERGHDRDARGQQCLH